MRKYLFMFSTLLMSGTMLSCSSTEDIDLGEAKQVVNMLSESEPIQLTQEQQVFANDNNGFTLNFLKTVNDVDKSGKSFIYSPLSITYVLGMVNDAATGQTEQEQNFIIEQEPVADAEPKAVEKKDDVSTIDFSDKEFDLSDISHKEKSREEIIAEAEAAAFAED